jgi:16S rRNA (adenine1518-N6/adenine1519-N6)-dimethyltransferase
MQHRPNRSLGQNFLRDAAVSQRIVDALNLQPSDQIIEIGPGQGALTVHLVKSGAAVITIEFDRNLAPELQRRFAASENLTVIEADALDVDLASLIHPSSLIPHPSAKLVANLPYNISTPMLQRLIEQREVFSQLVVMFQREVADRITAEPRNKERGFLSVIAQNAFEIERLFDVPPTALYPVPKVWSSVIRLTPKPRKGDEAKFREVVSQAFMQKRKTLANNLSSLAPDASSVIKCAGLADKVRAEELSLDDWRRLIDHL